MVGPASARRRAVSNPRLLLAPVINVVVMPPAWPAARRAASGLLFLGTAVPGSRGPGRAYWTDEPAHRAGRGAATRPPPPRPGRGRPAGLWPPPRAWPAARGTGPAGRHVGRLCHPPRAGPGQRAVGAGAHRAGPGAPAERRGPGGPCGPRPAARAG